MPLGLRFQPSLSTLPPAEVPRASPKLGSTPPILCHACLISHRCQSGLVHIWSLQTRRPVAILDGHGGQCVTWLHMLPQGQQLLR